MSVAKHVGALVRERGGMAAVEFAMVLPMLLLLLFAGVELGRLLTDYHAVTKSVRDATRYLTRVGLTCPGSGPSTGPITTYVDNAADATIARNLAMTGTVDTPVATADYLLKYWTDTTTVSTTVACVANGGLYDGLYAARPLIPRITVTANVPFTFLWGTLFTDSASITMSVSHSQTHVGG